MIFILIFERNECKLNEEKNYLNFKVYFSKLDNQISLYSVRIPITTIHDEPI